MEEKYANNLVLFLPTLKKRGWKNLTRERERELIERAQQGDAQATKELVECHLAFVVDLAGRLLKVHHKLPSSYFLDFLSWGLEGFLSAIKHYDKKYQTRLTTYATIWVRRVILENALKEIPLIWIPLYKQIKRRTKQEEIYPTIIGLDKIINYREEGGRATFYERIIDEREAYYPSLDQIWWQKTAKQAGLSKREKKIISRRLFKEETLTDMGRSFKICDEGIRQIRDKALEKLIPVLLAQRWEEMYQEKLSQETIRLLIITGKALGWGLGEWGSILEIHQRLRLWLKDNRQLLTPVERKFIVLRYGLDGVFAKPLEISRQLRLSIVEFSLLQKRILQAFKETPNRLV